MKIRIVYIEESCSDRTDPSYYTTIETKEVTINSETDHALLNPGEHIITRNSCSGMTDRNGTYIYEGDVCRVPTIRGLRHHIVKFERGCYTLQSIPIYEWIDEIGNSLLEVVGNIYEGNNGN